MTVEFLNFIICHILLPVWK